jgi:hypothetical protein
MLRLVAGLLFLFTAFLESGWAQMEIGTQFTALRQNPPGELSGAMGARASYDLHIHPIVLAPEIEFNYFLENPIASYAESQLLVGVRTGVSNGRVGAFFKVRPGMVNFFAGDFTQRNGTSTNLAVDVGGVLEYFVRPGMALRMDWGDMMVRFPHAINNGPFTPPRPRGWYQSLQSSIGVSVQF